MVDANIISTRTLLTALLLAIACFSSCKTSKAVQETNAETSVADRIYNDKVSVHLKEGIPSSSFEKKYAQYKLTYKGLTSKSQNIMLFTFDTNLISNPDMVKLLSKDKNVISAKPLSSITKKSSISRSSDKKTAQPVK